MTTLRPPSVRILAAIPPPAPEPMMQTSQVLGERITCMPGRLLGTGLVADGGDVRVAEAAQAVVPVLLGTRLDLAIWDGHGNAVPLHYWLKDGEASTVRLF